MKRLVFAVLLLIGLRTTAWCAVAPAFSGTASVGGSATASLDLSFTVSTGATCLIVTLGTNSTITSSGMHWDSAGTNQAMTTRGTFTNTARLEGFVLVNPTIGTLNLHANWTTNRNAVMIASAYSGADASTCVELAAGVTTYTSTGTSTAPSLDVTSAASDATMGACTATGSTFSATTGGTQIALDNSVTQRQGASYSLGPVSNTHSFTLAASVLWTCIGFHILNDGLSAGTTGQLLGVGK